MSFFGLSIARVFLRGFKDCLCNLTAVYFPIFVWQINDSISYRDGVLIWRCCLLLNKKPGKHMPAPQRKNLEMGHRRPRAHAVAKRQIYFTADLSKPWPTPGPALPKERRMETARTATRRRVSRRRLMLHIKQTKEIANLIVSHSLVQPNISKSDSLSLCKVKHDAIKFPPISLMTYDLAPSRSILLKEIFICHFKSNLVFGSQSI